MENENFYTYILVNKDLRVMYIGVTNDLCRRLREHRNEEIEGFTKRYHLHKLVYFERFSSPKTAIKREKELKGWTRKRKNDLISQYNPKWEDLSDSFT